MEKKMIAIILSVICIGVTVFATVGKDRYQMGGENTKVSSYTNIKPEEAKKRLETETGIVLLDVRTPEEYAEKHIPNSLLIPVDLLDKEAPSKISDQSATIFVYCRSGRRSVIASEILIKMGYSKVYNLGGIIDWPFETSIP